MANFRLRTHRYDDLTNWEIEQYLKTNDIIVVPVGNCETHAALPVDCEFVAVQGYAQLIAERVGGLFLPNLVYFNPGGTQIGRGTIHVSMAQSYSYCKAIAHSLLNQGFKRQIWIPSHVPTTDFLLAMVTDFFDETKVPLLYMDVNAYLSNLGLRPKMRFDSSAPPQPPTTRAGEPVDVFNDTMLGAYLLAGRLDAVPAKGEVDFPEAEQPEGFIPNWFPEYRLLGSCSSFMAAPAPYYYTHPDEHIGPPIARFTREELQKRAEIGLTYLRQSLEEAKLEELMAALRHLQDYMAQTVAKHYDHLPKNRYSAASPFYIPCTEA